MLTKSHTAAAVVVLVVLAGQLGGQSQAQEMGSRSALFGRIIAESGGPVPSANVEIRNIGTGFNRTLLTNGTGNFGLPTVESGSYAIQVSFKNFKTVMYDNVRLVSGKGYRLRLTLRNGGPGDVMAGAGTDFIEGLIVDVDVTSKQGTWVKGSISGQLKDDAGQVVSGAIVTIVRPAGTTSTSATSDTQGRWTIPVSEDGTVALTIRSRLCKSVDIKDLWLIKNTDYRVRITLDRGNPTQVIEGIIATFPTIVSGVVATTRGLANPLQPTSGGKIEIE